MINIDDNKMLNCVSCQAQKVYDIVGIALDVIVRMQSFFFSRDKKNGTFIIVLSKDGSY